MRTPRAVAAGGLVCIPRILILIVLAIVGCDDPVEVRCEPGSDCVGEPTDPIDRSRRGEGLDLRPGAPSVAWTMAATQTVPTDFVVEQVMNGFHLPTDLEFLPDGRMMVAELGGTIRMASGGSILSQPFLDFSDRVNECCNRGLLGIAAHPDWPNQPYVWLLAKTVSSRALSCGSGSLSTGSLKEHSDTHWTPVTIPVSPSTPMV